MWRTIYKLTKTLADLLPVPVFHSWVAGNGEDRDVLLEFINLDFHILC